MAISFSLFSTTVVDVLGWGSTTSIGKTAGTVERVFIGFGSFVASTPATFVLSAGI